MQSPARIIAACLAGGLPVLPIRLARAGEPAGAGRESALTAEASRFDALAALEAFTAPLLDGYRELSMRSDWLGRLDALATSGDGQIALACAGIAGLIALGIVLHIVRRSRRTGDLTLHLEFPEAIEGEFEIGLARRSTKRVRSTAGAARREGRPIRSGVRRETQLEGIAAGTWFLSIEGELRAPRSRAVLARIQEELEVVVEAQGKTEILHRLPDVEAPVELRVHWDRQVARDVGLCVDGLPQSLRYAAQGQFKTTLALGAHALVVGAGDRVVERSVRIESYEPKVVHLDLASPEGLVFKGCPPAVNAFLEGDLGTAARALDRDGQTAVGSLLRARLHQEQGLDERAAEQLEHANRLHEAALLRRSLGQHVRAARLFEQAGLLAEAAACYAEGEAWSDAARSYRSIGAFADVDRCCERAGDTLGRIDALEARGDLFRAAALASELDDRARAIRLLQQIGPKDPDFGRATELLALAYEQEGHHDLAARQLERRLELLAPGESAPGLELHLAELLEELHEYGRALDVLQALREREPTHPHVATRIETLRKKLSSPNRSAAFETTRTPPAGATAFVSAERYEILEEIGRGGMGRVYKAHDRRLGRIVALKRMPESLRQHAAAVQLFLGEARAAARMNHPHIVTLYDADQDADGYFFITMEYLEGLPLSTVLRERGHLGLRDTLRLGLQVCAGLQYAHEQGIVHRDIKTANLFLTRDRKLKIMDFGLAKILEAVREGESTIIAGTPDYMAPEQSAGRVSDGRTDLYALGVTLFELSTGRLPHRDGAPADPSGGHPEPPDALAHLIRALMAPDPADRPASASVVGRALAAMLASESEPRAGDPRSDA